MLSLFAAPAVAAASFLLCFLALPPAIRRFRAWGIQDVPGDDRRMHSEAVPTAGGLVVMGGTALTAWVIGELSGFAQQRPMSGALLLALLLTLLGFADDLRPQRAGAKFFFLAAAALLFLLPQDLSPGVLLLSLLWVLLVTNAFNLIDGIDGLAASCGCVYAVGLGIMTGAGTAFALAGALAAFACFNRAPASVFLGNAGANGIGFLLATWSWQSLYRLFPQGEGGSFAPEFFSLFPGMTVHAGGIPAPAALFAPFLLLAFPLTDALWAMVRRGMHRRPLFTGDRQHIHHRLAERLGVRAAADGLALFSLLSMLTALVGYGTSLRGLFGVCLSLLAGYGLLYSLILAQKKRLGQSQDALLHEIG